MYYCIIKHTWYLVVSSSQCSVVLVGYECIHHVFGTLLAVHDVGIMSLKNEISPVRSIGSEKCALLLLLSVVFTRVLKPGDGIYGCSRCERSSVLYQMQATQHKIVLSYYDCCLLYDIIRYRSNTNPLQTLLTS